MWNCYCSMWKYYGYNILPTSSFFFLVFFILFINSTVPSPSSSTRYSRFPMPTPCSPVHVPSRAIARWTIRWTAARAFSSSSSFRKSKSAWKLPALRGKVNQSVLSFWDGESPDGFVPSPTCPTIVDTMPCCARSSFVPYTSSGRRDGGTLR